MANSFTTIKISEAIELRTHTKAILEKIEMLPAGTVVQLFPETANFKYDYRDDDGTVKRSSTGFLHPLRILSVPNNIWDQAKIDRLNLISSGLYVSALIERDIQGTQGNFDPVSLGEIQPDFLNSFHPTGKPKVTFTDAIEKRFPGRINKGVDPATMSPADREKSTRLYRELVAAVNRMVETPKGLLMIPTAEGRRLSEEYEKTGFVNPFGAWTVAVQGTAVRHDFANVPCAEFMSEVVRQAYSRGGYNVHEDFNPKKGNTLIWKETASVVGLSAALIKAGWVPWDPKDYRPPTGALLFHRTGRSPGHTYISAGHDGQLIVDNGAPQGRALRLTNDKTLKLMYQTGLFILPPGIQPQPW